ncbi:MAG: FliM/FliN family flagellar motor C-terminal domain-containing protein [Sulfurovum sp.]|nr:FliM/FliN family flagellar motor C-terminal domain-containing protein [Sulfurovum sp.]
MKNETQAFHLAKMMQTHTRYPMYELALPLVSVRSSKLKKLNVDDVILTGFNTLEFVLIDGDIICANVLFKQMENAHGTEISYLLEDTIKQYDSKKYEILKISFGTVQSKVLEVGHTIDITHIDLEKVSLVLEDKMIAEGTLVKVDEEIAIQIKKVN